MKNDDLDRLLAGVLEAEELQALRQSTLEAGLAHLRRRGRRRRMLQTCGAGLLILAALVVIWRVETVPRRSQRLAGEHLTAPGPTAGVQIINDEQLFALFPNRSLALVGKPGHQQLVFLDQATTTDQVH